MAKGSSGMIFILLIFLLLVGVGVYIYFGTNLLKSPGDSCKPTSEQTDSHGLNYILDKNKKCIVSNCSVGFSVISGICKADTPTTVTPTTGTPTTGTPTTGTPTTVTPTPSIYSTDSQTSGSGLAGINPGDDCVPPVGASIDNVLTYKINPGTLQCSIDSCSLGYELSVDKKTCKIKEGPQLGRTQSGILDTYDCARSFQVNNTSLCKDDGSAGIHWNWNSAAQQYCESKVGYYEIIVYSSQDSKAKYTMHLKDPEAISAAITGMWSSFYKEKDITFTIQPFDKNGVKMIDQPMISIADATITRSCDSLATKKFSVIPYWQETKNLIEVTQRNKGGGNQGGWWVWNDSGVEIEDSGRTRLYNGTGTTIVPKNGRYVLTCQMPSPGYSGENYDLTWDRMIDDGAAEAGYKYYVSTHCYGGNAKDGGDNTMRPGSS